MKPASSVRLLSCLIGVNLALIWGNSLTVGETSAAFSGGLLEWIGTVFPALVSEAGHTFLRKAAHFCEFGLLGVLTSARAIASGKTLRPGLTGWGVAAACVDETIQLFVPGRCGSVIDVCIDAAGFSAGMLLTVFGYSLAQTLSKHKQQNVSQKGEIQQ